MKRTHSKAARNQAAEAQDIKRDVPEAQLARIAAVALAYNDAEALIDQLFATVAALPDYLQLEISTRMYGMDAKIEIINIGARKILASKKDSEAIVQAVGKAGFKKLKGYRDCIIHARHINTSTWVGIKIDRQAAVYDVLLNQKALEAAYDHLVALRKELEAADMLLNATKLFQNMELDDPERSPIESKVLETQALYRTHHKARLDLAPMPEFPAESELREAGFLLQAARQAAVMSWYPSWQPHQPQYYRRSAWLYQQPATDTPPPLKEEKK